MVVDESPRSLGDSLLGGGGDEIEITFVLEGRQNSRELQEYTQAAAVVVGARRDAVVAVRLQEYAGQRGVGPGGTSDDEGAVHVPELGGHPKHDLGAAAAATQFIHQLLPIHRGDADAGQLLAAEPVLDTGITRLHGHPVGPGHRMDHDHPHRSSAGRLGSERPQPEAGVAETPFLDDDDLAAYVEPLDSRRVLRFPRRLAGRESPREGWRERSRRIWHRRCDRLGREWTLDRRSRGL